MCLAESTTRRLFSAKPTYKGVLPTMLNTARIMGMFLVGCLTILLLAVQCSAFVRDETEHVKANSNDPIGKKKYVVYMGAKGEVEAEALVLSQQNILADAVGSEEEALSSMVHSYKHAFNGFSAWLTEAQADYIAELPEVVKVFPSRTLQLQTTRSWDFLGSRILDSSNSTTSHDIIVGVLDTGVWPESESFRDDGMGPVPARWKGTCDNGKVTNASEIIHCNKKLIGVRSYTGSSGMFQNARDEVGHGTHTTSTVGGRVVKGANVFGLATGNARGGLPSARVAMYKVCSDHGCSGDAVLAGFDDAIHDGVDILSLSLGGSPSAYDMDPMAIASFHATEKGILVSCAGGNSGPSNSSVSNAAPWILTVGASTIDRSFAAKIILGNGRTLLGTALNFNHMQKPSKIVSGADAVSQSGNPAEASFCAVGSLDAQKVEGNIIACTFDPSVGTEKEISTALQNMGAAGLILGNDFFADLMSYFVLPGAMVKIPVLQEILAYTKTSNPMASILPTQTVLGTTPAPTIAGFSSRGPNFESQDILKPDVSAPGVDILAAWSPIVPVYYIGNNISLPVYSNFSVISGTSMACPHVSGAAAFLKSVHPEWSPAAIKSALMTTAKYLDNTNSSIKDYDGTEATPFATGAGEISPEDALNPGLVYDIIMDDYVTYLCASGYSSAKLKVITGRNNVSCPVTLGAADLNYPSITIPKLGETLMVARTVTNVGPANSVYKLTVEPPLGVGVAVFPRELNFTSAGQKLRFILQVTGTGEPLEKWVFGSITWTSGSFSVRSPLAVKG